LSDGVIVNPEALEPLFAPWEMPTRHRVRAKREGEPAEVVQGRRPSSITIAQNLRRDVGEWRQAEYAGASDTTRELLMHWFERDHFVTTPQGDEVPFRYYFCQREAVESLIYLIEVRGLGSLSKVTGEFGHSNPDQATLAALGIAPEEDLWPKYAFKVATGAGKTKIMSLAIVWSYFHALRESASPMARHFVVIAPNLTVYERLKEDFGDASIFDADPLIPEPWRGDWNLSVVLQDEASGAATGGVLYLTNIHRLYDVSKRKKKEPETYPWMGPPVSKARALDTGEVLRERITSHQRVMLMNDEAHHVWDPDSAWNEAITYLHETLQKRSGHGLVAQLDFSATPKDDKGNIFKHVVCDAPLGEAVDAGIVKTPIIGRGQRLVERAHADASYRYENHVSLGYVRWQESTKEWARSGKKPLMFVMTENTEAADEIARRLNSDPIYTDLNGKTINLHTNLKGKLKKRGRGGAAYYEFVESEKEISDEDLKELRRLSRELDQDTSPYGCIVSVLMLREGWDVRNVTTIVPLRPYTSKANILPEQTLGRGLRRIMPQGNVAEVVTVVEHPAFTSLYKEQLSQEGLDIAVVDADKVPRTTVSIFPDAENKDLEALDLLIPRLTPAYRIVPKLDDLTFEDVERQFARFPTLPLGRPISKEIKYEGRHLFTNEIVEEMMAKLPLLENSWGAISFYREELERITRIKGTHSVLAPLIQRFLQETLFGEHVELNDPRLTSRLADGDVREYIRATFVPLIRAKTTLTEERVPAADPHPVTAWRPFQVTHSERRPVEEADKTPFNLVPCNRELEVAFTAFADNAPDVTAFCKNAGPQSLRIDYLASGGRLAFYTPDFIVRLNTGNYLLVETKGREDKDVPNKARAAVAWCKAASTKKVQWQYLYVPQGIFSEVSGAEIEELVRACGPTLATILKEAVGPQMALPLFEAEEAPALATEDFIPTATLEALPPRYRKSVEQAVTLFRFLEKKESATFGPVFQPLLGPLDDASTALIVERLSPHVPADPQDQKVFFEPLYEGLNRSDAQYHARHASNLRRTLVHKNGLMPLGLLEFCLQYCRQSHEVGGVFAAVRGGFADLADTPMVEHVERIYDFRNNHVAHVNVELTDRALAETGLKEWVEGLALLFNALRPTAISTN
jgi:type III restriction enzyme